jgi:hypothetical protein
MRRAEQIEVDEESIGLGKMERTHLSWTDVDVGEDASYDDGERDGTDDGANEGV